MVTPALAQDSHIPPAEIPKDLGAPPDAAPGFEATGGHGSATEAHGGEHGGFPPFDPASYASQLLWLALSFGFLYWLMSRVVLPRIGGILAERDGRVAADLTAASQLKSETDAAIAAYEQSLAEARQRAQAIAAESRDASKAAVDAERKQLETGLNDRLGEAETRIQGVKAQALANVDAIARDATEALVESLLGAGVSQGEVAAAVDAAVAERS